MVAAPLRRNDVAMYFYLEAMTAAGRDALRRRSSMQRDDAGFEELSLLLPDGHLAARRGNTRLGEPEWAITIFGLEMLAELLALDALAERATRHADEAGRYRISPSRSARATAPALSETSHLA